MADLSLFGYTLSKKKPEAPKQSFVVPQDDDGATTVNASGFFGTYMDIDAAAKNENDLISRYRDVAAYPDCDSAIEDIVNEAVASQDDEAVVKLDLEKVELSSSVKKLIEEEFTNVLKLLDFHSKSHDIFKRWYIDGRVYYHKIVDASKGKEGIQELRYIDPRKIKKVRKVNKVRDQKTGVDFIEKIEEFFIYNEKGLMMTVPNTANQSMGLQISPDSICFVSSGILDLDKNMVMGYLQKAIKVVNQLKMTEDSLVIYRMTRAPERRIFYIDVGNLPKAKAEQYVKSIMNQYRNKVTYDATTGEVRDEKKTMSMLEDFWMPRREGGKGTEITTLEGGQNLGQIDDINYFQNKLYGALNVPLSRMKPDQGMNFGRQAEITRDELKFSKFISRLRKKFSELFDDLLKTQLVLKGIMSAQDWDKIKEDVYYNFTQDAYVAEAKESEILRNRLDLLNTINPFVGTYFSREYVYDKILQLTEEEWDDMQTDIANDTDLQQQLQAQQQAQQGQPPQGPMDNSQQAQQDGPAPYDPNNPMVENTAIHNIMELRKFKL
jgi:DNA-dependent RNA polymerase auxiliary subunit epsilon